MLMAFWIFLVISATFGPSRRLTADALRITQLYVPRTAHRDAHLDCRYDLEGEPLYDVKWYKDDMQFFGCAADGTVHEYPVEGVTIKYSSYATVGSCPVELIALADDAGGRYKCEVSLDAPTFRTASQATVLRVAQYARRTQELSDVSTEESKSLIQNQSNATSKGTSRGTFLFPIVVSYLIVFLFCTF